MTVHYEEPAMEVIELYKEDVLTTSGLNPGQTGSDGDDNFNFGQ